MKKSTRKLALDTQIIRSLTEEPLRAAAGGIPGPFEGPGFIMRDTVIVRP